MQWPDFLLMPEHILTWEAKHERIPATGAVVIAAPLKIADGSGSPLRVLAIVPA